MNNGSNQNIGFVGLIATAAVVIIFGAVAIVGLVLTFVVGASEPNTAVATPIVELSESIVEDEALTSSDATPLLAEESAETASEIEVVEVPTEEAPEPVEADPVEPEPTVAPDAINRLVVVSSDAQLLTVDPDGGNQRELTKAQNSILFSFPAWSPDSQSIAAIGNGRGQNPEGVYVLEDSAETTPRPVYTSERIPIYLYWSPDSEQISFITPGEPGTEGLSLRISPRDGFEESRFVASGAPLYWDWASDSSELLFNTSSDEHSEFAFLDAASGDIGDDIAEAGFFASPDISADDNYLAFSIGGRGNHRLIIADRDGGELNRIPHLGSAAFAWSPTANQLAYSSPRRPSRSTYGALQLVEPDGEPRLLVDDDIINFYWSPDGTKIAYFTVEGQRAPEVEASRSRTVLSSRSPQQAQQPTVRLNLWVIDVNSGEVMQLGRFVPSRLFLTQFIPFFDQYARSHSIWAPDSQAFALPVDENGNSVIYRFSIDGSLPARIVEGEIAFWSHQ